MNIAMWHAGFPPIKWKEQGRFIADGRDPIYDWNALIPHKHKAHSLNPQQGFLSQTVLRIHNEIYFPNAYYSLESPLIDLEGRLAAQIISQGCGSG